MVNKSLKYFTLLVLIFSISKVGCEKPTEVVLDNDSDPNSETYIPNDPSNIEIYVKENQVDLRWVDNSEGEDGFLVKRSVNGFNYELVKSLEPNQTSWTDTLNLPTYPVVYGVQSYSKSGESNLQKSDTLYSYVSLKYEIDGEGSIQVQNFSILPDTLAYGSNITVFAEPYKCWKFSSWNQTIDKSHYSLKIVSDTTLRASFIEDQSLYNLNLTQVGSGNIEVTPEKEDYKCDEKISILAKPDAGWGFGFWNGDFRSNANPLELNIISDVQIEANFSINYYPINLEIQGNGSVTEQVIQTKTSEYEYGTKVQLTAVADEHWEFVEWGGDASGTSDSFIIDVLEERNVVAIFQPKKYGINISIEGNGSVTEQVIQSKTSEYEYGTKVQLTAVADENWEFVGWGGDIEAVENPTVISPSSDMNITALFSRPYFSVTQTVVGGGTLDINVINGNTRNGKYESGTELSVTAVPADRSWYFDHWEGDLTGVDIIKTLFVDSEKDLVAVFKNSVMDSDGNEYQIVRIGEQIWMAENINVGTKINSTNNQYDNGEIEKYCYSDNNDYCNVLGGLYTYKEAMNYIFQDGSKGICMEGWRIPTDNDWQTLEINLGMSQSDAGRNGWRGSDQGTQLKSSEYFNGSNSSGFSSLPVGIYFWGSEGYEFMGLNSLTAYISSNIKTVRQLSYINSEIKRTNEHWGWDESALSVRCIKD